MQGGSVHYLRFGGDLAIYSQNQSHVFTALRNPHVPHPPPVEHCSATSVSTRRCFRDNITLVNTSFSLFPFLFRLAGIVCLILFCQGVLIQIKSFSTIDATLMFLEVFSTTPRFSMEQSFHFVSLIINFNYYLQKKFNRFKLILKE